MEGWVTLHIPNSRLHDNLFIKPGGQSSPLINTRTPNLIEESPQLLKIGVSESSSWLHPWPFFIWGHGGLFFPGWLCLSTWPHKDRQRWLSYVNTCWGIAPLTLHEICPNKPNVSTGKTVHCFFWHKLSSCKARAFNAVNTASASCLKELGLPHKMFIARGF